jgi:putative oxidoreductase
MSFLSPYSSVLLSLLRFMTGLLVLQHGTVKFLNIPTHPQMNNMSPMTLVGFAGVLELVGGILLVLGLFTRPAAFILSGMMAVAYFHTHAPQGFYPLLNGGELAVLYCFTLLYIASAGGGSISFDRAAGLDS